MTRAAIYPGTFDPITNGHIDLVQRGRALFDRVVVAVASNPQKGPLFTARERLAMARAALADLPGVEVRLFDDLTIDFARRHGCATIIRGLRAVSDFEYELQIALTNRDLNPGIETVFLAPSIRYVYLSSRIVKEVASYGGPVGELVPPLVERRLRAKFRTRADSATLRRSGRTR